MRLLTRNQLDKFREKLSAMRKELVEALSHTGEVSRPVEPDSAIGRISRIDAIQMQQMSQANRRTAQRRLDQITAALQRIEDGDYGECAECGEELAIKRLQARPEAPFCVPCQSRRERRR